MRISICIPQYNRIELLLTSLRIIEQQTYDDIEIVISDDCSTDNTREEIEKLQRDYKYPVRYFRFETNQGYDRNYRKSIELATGEYCFVIGNDDTLHGNDSIAWLVDFLEQNNYPDIGFCNYIEDGNNNVIVERALESKVQGSGIECAIQHANSFSFVGGLIYKKETFQKFNRGDHDGSIYAQMYISLLMIAQGSALFTIQKAMVVKDMLNKDGSFRWCAYKNGLPKNWKEFKIIQSGLKSVMDVLIAACRDAGKDHHSIIYRIMRRMYTITYPYWIEQYKHHGSLAAGCGLIVEMNPLNNKFLKELPPGRRAKIIFYYMGASAGGLLLPFKLFNQLQPKLHRMVRQ